jgi:site-specific DNA-methyltransferase (cytosine-N4-specific)
VGHETRSEVAATPAAVIHRGDAFDLIGSVDAASVDLIVTSPPYWGLRSYGLEHSEDVLEKWEDLGCPRDRVPPYDWYVAAGGQLGQEPLPSWFVTHLVEFFERARRVLKPEASIWLNLGDTYFARWSSIRDRGRQGIAEGRTRRKTPSGGYLHDKQLLLLPARVAIELQDAGWILRNDLIWSKPNPMPRPEKDRLRLAHEHWFHFVQRRTTGRPRYYYDLTQAEEGGLDVVSVSPVAGTNGHSAAFPPALVGRRIASTCPPGGLVLDPFCGTGRAVAESVRLGRRAIGFERQAGYAKEARRALKQALADDPVSQTRNRAIVSGGG